MMYSPFTDSKIIDVIGAVSTGVNFNQIVYTLPVDAYIYARDLGSSGAFSGTNEVTAEVPVGFITTNNKLWGLTGAAAPGLAYPDAGKIYPAGTNIRVNVTGNTNANYRIRIHALLAE